MRKTSTYSISLFAVTLIFAACGKNDYRVGGDLHSPNINMTTYDYLKSNRDGLFDTLLLLVDLAGIKDKINQPGATFFAPTDYAINNYVERRTRQVQKVDPFQKWTLDSIITHELPRFADSLDIYFVKEQLPNSELTPTGKVYKNAKNNDVVVSYEETTEKNMGKNDNSTLLPQVVYFTYLFQPIAPGFDVKDIALPVGIRTLVQTSNARTTTGTLHVLQNSHTLFFYR